MASNDINARLAANVLTAASAFKTTSFGQLIAQANKRPRSLPSSMDAAAKPSIAAFAVCKSGSARVCLQFTHSGSQTMMHPKRTVLR